MVSQELYSTPVKMSLHCPVRNPLSQSPAVRKAEMSTLLWSRRRFDGLKGKNNTMEFREQGETRLYFVSKLSSGRSIQAGCGFAVCLCGSSQLLRPPREWSWQLWQRLCHHPAEEHQLPMPMFKSLQHSQSALGPPNLMLTKTKLGCIYVIHLVPNITQTMHTPGSKLSVLAEFGHIKCSEYLNVLTNLKCCYKVRNFKNKQSTLFLLFYWRFKAKHMLSCAVPETELENVQSNYLCNFTDYFLPQNSFSL